MMKLAGMNVVSANPKKLAEFYRDVLGAVIDETHGAPHRIEIWFGPQSDDTTWIAAIHDSGFLPPKFNVCHGFEFRVDNADIEYERIRGLGIEIKEPPKDLPWGYRYFHIQDPDGNGIDLVQKQ